MENKYVHKAPQQKRRRSLTSIKQDDLVKSKDRSRKVSDSIEASSIPAQIMTASDEDAVLALSICAKELKKCEQPYFGLTCEEFCFILLRHLLGPSSVNRAAAIRVLRYILNDEVLSCIISLHIDFIIARSLVVKWEKRERIEAFKFVCTLNTACSLFPPLSIIHALFSLIDTEQTYDDPFCVVSVEVLCEIAINHPLDAARAGLLRNILDFVFIVKDPCLLEGVMLSVLFCLERISLDQNICPHVLNKLLAILFEKEFRRADKPSSYVKENFTKGEEMVMLAIKICFSSWAGRFAHFIKNNFGMKTLCDALYSGIEHREELTLRIFYLMMDVTYPENCDTFHAAMRYNANQRKRQYQLNLYHENYGFVAAECYATLLPRFKFRPDLSESNKAFMLSMLVSSGFIEKLSYLCIYGARRLYAASSFLLAEFLVECSRLLPYDLSFILLPVLISTAMSKKDPYVSVFAYACVSNVDLLFKHKCMEENERSVFLEELLVREMQRNTRQKVIMTAAPDITLITVKSNIHQDDPMKWNWEVLYEYVKACNRSKINYGIHKHLLNRILAFFHPGPKGFSAMPADTSLSRLCLCCGLELMDILIYSNQDFLYDLLKSFVGRLNVCFEKLMKYMGEEGTLFSKSVLLTTCSQYYFLFIGKLSATERSRELLTNLFSIFRLMLQNKDFSIYLVLALTCLNYCSPGPARDFFQNVLLSSEDTALRAYCANLMRVFLRIRCSYFHSWVLKLLIALLYDSDAEIVATAADILDEALVDEDVYKETLAVHHNLRVLGDHGILLQARMVSREAGFIRFSEEKILPEMLKLWEKSFNKRYPKLIERSLSTYYSNYSTVTLDGVQRKTFLKQQRRFPMVLPHLYRELCYHEKGFNTVIEQSCVQRYFRIIESSDHSDLDEMKAALWAVGSICATKCGMEYALTRDFVAAIVRLAETSPYIEIRSTSFYVTSLISVTHPGADLLDSLEWVSCLTPKGDEWSPSFAECFTEPTDNDFSETTYVDAFPTKKSFRSETADTDSGIDVDKVCTDKTLTTIDDVSEPPKFDFEMKFKKSPFRIKSNLNKSVCYIKSMCFDIESEDPWEQSSSFMLNEEQEQYTYYREITGQYTYNIFSFWLGDEDVTQRKCERARSDTSRKEIYKDLIFKGLTIPFNISLLLSVDQSSEEPDPFDTAARSRATTSSTISSFNIKRTQSYEHPEHFGTFEDQGAAQRIIETTYFLASSAYSKQFERQLLREKKSNPKEFCRVDLFYKICSILASVETTCNASRFLYELFKDLDISQLTQVENSENFSMMTYQEFLEKKDILFPAHRCKSHDTSNYDYICSFRSDNMSFSSTVDTTRMNEMSMRRHI